MLASIPHWIVLVSLAANLTVCVAFLLHLRQQRRSIHSLGNQVSQVNEQLLMLSDSGKGVGRKVVALDQRLKHTERKQQELEANDVQQVSYNEAARLLSLGADVEDLVTTCGLSRAEADLIKVLHSSQVPNQARYK